jgi:hypothetical protein
MPTPIWNTPKGTIGAFGSNSAVSIQLLATPVSPATSLRYNLIVGSLPSGLSLSTDGLLVGVITGITSSQTFTFVVRVTDNLNNVSDRTFNISVSGVELPRFTTPAGEILRVQDSTWIEYKINFTSPEENTRVGLIQGQLPPGLEINEHGLIRGYPAPPLVDFSFGRVENAVITITDNKLIGYSTSGYRTGRPIRFIGTLFGGLQSNTVYYVRDVIDTTTFTISTTVNGPVLELDDSSGYMLTDLSPVTLGQPTIQTYNFSLLLITQEADNIIRNFSITVVNQNAPSSIGGAGRPFNTRTPTILNTRPRTFRIENDISNFRYYLLPDDSGRTYLPSEEATLFQTISDNQFAFRVLGLDFDNNELEYEFFDLPLGLQGDPITGWVKGNPVIANNTINRYVFSARAFKKNNPNISTPVLTFALIVKNNLSNEITWRTSDDLGTVFNGTASVLQVRAESSVDLQYFLLDGTLPPNLSLTETGDIIGTVAFQPQDFLSEPGTTKEYFFTVRAYSPEFSIISSEKTFCLKVKQLFPFPTDTVYATCTPDVSDRNLIKSLLEDATIIPDDMIYRINDDNFGKADKVVYEHLYGGLASGFEQYLAAITKNHYKKRVILGELKTAIARDQITNEIIYEVVYSKIVDDLANPGGQSVSKNIQWPRPILINDEPQEFINIVHPNSLENMRAQLRDVLGAVNNTNLLPLWMTTQQENGSTLGFTPAWVICYTKPGFSEIIKNNIETKWKDEIGRNRSLNRVDFVIDRFTIGKTKSFNYDNNLTPPAWTSLPSGVPEETVTEKIFTFNEILDRNASEVITRSNSIILVRITASDREVLVPLDKDSKDFYVLFPRQTILPSQSE